MKGRIWTLGLIAVVVSLLTSKADAQGPGWVLNLEKSAFAETAEPMRARLGAAPEHTGLILASTGVAPRGLEKALVLTGDQLTFNSDVQFTARLDGRDYPISGLPAGDTIAIKIGGDADVVSTIKAGGSKVARFERSLSADEKTLIVTARYFGEDGQVARERLIFEKR